MYEGNPIKQKSPPIQESFSWVLLRTSCKQCLQATQRVKKYLRTSKIKQEIKTI